MPIFIKEKLVAVINLSRKEGGGLFDTHMDLYEEMELIEKNTKRLMRIRFS